VTPRMVCPWHGAWWDGALLTVGDRAPDGDHRAGSCCAKQDKFWVEGAPDGERWEIYTVLDDNPTEPASSVCCA